jgi:hypothetical protein
MAEVPGAPRIDPPGSPRPISESPRDRQRERRARRPRREPAKAPEPVPPEPDGELPEDGEAEQPPRGRQVDIRV